MKREPNYSLLQHNTFGIDARCRHYVEVSTLREAQMIFRRFVSPDDVPFIIIGGGSNLLLTGDYPGTVVRSAIRGIEQDGDLLICGAGEVWDDVVAESLNRGLYGAENLSLIPGEVGASAVQNIGAYGAEAKDLIEWVEAVEIGTGAICLFSNEECRYAYRQSRFKQDWRNRFLITRVAYRFSRTFTPKLDYGNIRAVLSERGITEPTPEQLRQAIIDIRNAKLPDPKVQGNAGSFFMNPIVPREKYEALAAQHEGMPHYTIDADHEKIPAGWMIDQCGWKGKTMGRAGVHDKQALVLVNRGGATGAEVVTLMKAIQEDVKSKFDIEIHPEVNIV